MEGGDWGICLAVEHVFEELELCLCDGEEEEEGGEEGDGCSCHDGWCIWREVVLVVWAIEVISHFK